MANPQKENGYTPIANELLEALARIRINGESRQVLDVIIRKTYGFNKKSDRISLSQFCGATLLKKPTICKALNKLKTLNLITQKDNELGSIWLINKDFDTWKPLPKKLIITQKGNRHYPKSQQSLPKKVHTIEIPKETITKERHTIPPLLDWVIAYCQERKNGIDPQRFFDFYSASGWMRNKTKIRDWQACVRTWEKQGSQSTDPLMEDAIAMVKQCKQEQGEENGANVAYFRFVRKHNLKAEDCLRFASIFELN